MKFNFDIKIILLSLIILTLLYIVFNKSKSCESFHTDRQVCGANKKRLDLMLSHNELDPVRLKYINNNCRSRNTNTTGRDFYGVSAEDELDEHCEDLTCQSICNDDVDCEVYPSGFVLEESQFNYSNLLK
jgi:hypothetical protein